MDERVAIRDGGEVSRSFKLAQLWAKANTSTESLFAVDPAVSYAWRDFSARSSYGTFRDWGFVSLAYVADNAKYLEGKRRALIFGVNIDEINESAVYKGNGPNDYIYRKVIKKSYNSMDYAQVKKFLNDENIDYYVLNKVDHMYFEELKDYSVYRNEHYMIIGRDKINLNK